MITPPDFSVLLLAWDDADPGVAVLGGSALPPTLPLVYHLAAQHPTVALYPHLPAPAATPPTEAVAPAEAQPEAEAEEGEAIAAPAALAPPANEPGVRLLGGPPTAATAPAVAATSRLVGLSELYPTPAGLPATALGAIVPAVARLPATAGRSQWPTEALVPGLSWAWQAPAAPYLGAAEVFPPPPPAPPRPATSRPTAAITTATLRQQAGGVAAPAMPLGFRPRQQQLPAAEAHFAPAAHAELTEEMGAAEAADLDEPEDDLLPDEPAPAAAAVPAPVPPAPAPAPAPAPTGPPLRIPALNGLNARMIQYARQAARLVRDHPDFGVIYAPNWPAWLAALEIRNRTGRPLVLYAAGLAADFTAPAERGWLLEIERMALRRAHLILVPDADVQRRLLATYGQGLGEVRVLAAVDEAALHRVLAEMALR